MIRPQGIIFDKDGTLFDFASTWEAWAAAFLSRVARTEMHAREMGKAIGFDLERRKFDRDSIVIAGTPGEVAAVLAQCDPVVSGSTLLDVLNEEAERAPQVEAVMLEPYLSRLRKSGYALGVVTNDALNPALAHLRAAGVEDLFDFIAGFDSGHGAKPEPGPLLAFSEATGLAPEAVVMVGDSTHDLIAGRRAGMRCVGVLTGLAEREVLQPYADVVLPDIGHLPAWIEAQS